MPDDTYAIIFVVAAAIWIALAVAVGYLARRKGYGLGLGFVIALVTSFPAAFLVFLLLPDRSKEYREEIQRNRDRRDQFKKAQQQMFERAREGQRS